MSGTFFDLGKSMSHYEYILCAAFSDFTGDENLSEISEFYIKQVKYQIQYNIQDNNKGKSVKIKNYN